MTTQPRQHGALLYCYCVLEPGTPAFQILNAGTVAGVEESAPLFPVTAGALAAAVSNVPADTYDERGLNEMVNDLNRVGPLAVKHSAAIQELFLAGPAVVPLSLGAVYRHRDGIEDLLTKDAALFTALLARFHDRQEWGLKAFGDRAKVEAAAARESERLRDMAKDVEESTPGRGFFLRKQEQRLRGEEAEGLVQRTMTQVFDTLAEVSAEARVDEVGGVPADGLPLLFKAEFLVDRHNTGAFHAHFDDARKHPAELSIQVEANGPWPPYSFAKGGAHGKLVSG